MTGQAPALQVEARERIAAFDLADWDRLANPPGLPHDPFISWTFLNALEESRCATEATGWAGRHLALTDGAGMLVGAMPLWLKSHSQGEYVFDHAFADAWERAGGRWWPKLVSAVPFNPVPGRRLLVGDGPGSEPARAALAVALARIAADNGLATAQVNFATGPDLQALGDAGFVRRDDRQFHFFNRGWRDFADFLDSLTSERRKTLRKERARAQAGLEIVRLSGSDLDRRDWDAFFECYQDTGDRKWGQPYLNRAFFEMIGARMPERILLVLAREAGRPVAAALNFLGGDALYGRWWGRLEERPFLHFELCYYQAVDEALARGLTRVEAGAQGGHKLARGYLPVATWQASSLPHAGLRAAVADFCARESAALAEDDPSLARHVPFRRGDRHADTLSVDGVADLSRGNGA